MWSPREKASTDSPTPSAASPPPSVSTPSDLKVDGGPMSPRPGAPNGIFNSFSKMLFGGEGEGGEPPKSTPEHSGAATANEPSSPPAATPHAFITSSPRRSPAPPGMGASGAPSTPISVHVSGDGPTPQQTAMSPRTGSLLDSIFSPVFHSIFGQKDAAQKASDADSPQRETRDATAHRVAAAAAAAAERAAAEAQAAVAAEAEAEAAHEEAVQQRRAEAYVTDEFDPYAFIKSLPPLASLPERPIVLPRKTRGSPGLTLVLDLDETLLHSSIVPLAEYDIVFPVHFNNANYQVYVRKRPHLDYFMAKVASMFEVVVFTASQRVYADRLLSIIDPGRRWVKHRLFRDSCVLVDGNYLKDLIPLGRDLTKTMIIDNSPQAFGFQLDNGIPIESWFDDPNDRELLKMLPFLESLLDTDDVRPNIRSKFKLHELINAAPRPGRR
mmetsp:Transcript_23323/g.54003  ORF Transcript_23323/g.54003 Transcript_23323/m.54003 type:complete len:441 (+) Transcript_23323:62-1384(+)